MEEKIIIGLTESETNFHYYADWLAGDDPLIEIRVLSHLSYNIHDFDHCDGIVLSGGVDSHPKFYNNPRLDYPLAQEFQELRDEWEIMLFEKAKKNKIPVLAICRGMQIINIALGGDLIQDQEEIGKQNHRQEQGIDQLHKINIKPGSLLAQITGKTESVVNSAHHQALDKMASSLTVVAIADDQTIEAVEYADHHQNHFLLGVQWHPERAHITDADFSMSTQIRDAFLKQIQQQKLSYTIESKSND